MQALLTGPTDAEKRQGFISLIPEGTQVIAARVLKDTAYIDLSESFQYNTYGVEGYAGQLDQVIWTATEFANVKNVQILVDGRRLDYLGEGIWIGTPLGRDRF
jgi:spore germination protein GerM